MQLSEDEKREYSKYLESFKKVRCDLCNAEAYGLALSLKHSGWTLGRGFAICPDTKHDQIQEAA
jgi:hypothetical protein